METEVDLVYIEMKLGEMEARLSMEIDAIIALKQRVHCILNEINYVRIDLKEHRNKD